MAAVKRRKPASKTDLKAGNKKIEAKSDTGEVAAKKAGSDSPRAAKSKPAAQKGIKRETKTGSASPKTTKLKPVRTEVEKNGVDEQKEVNNSGITKVYLEKKESCAVTFRLPEAAVSKAKTVCIVGDFNNWNIYADPMKRRKDGTYSIELELSKGREYQFRYLIDDCRWENDWNADKYVRNPFGDSDNSVVIV